MTQRTPSRFSKVNKPRLALWLASLVVAAAGYLLLTSSNAKEAAVYASGTADYPKLFAAQSGSTVGGLLIAVGVLGLLLALATLVLAWRPPVAAETPARDEADFDDDDLDEVPETDDLVSADGAPKASDSEAVATR